MIIFVFVCVAVVNFSPALSNTNNVQRYKRSDDYVPCERGWYYFRDKCYKAGGRKLTERLTWERALARCKSWGADLVSIQSQEEQDFLIVYLQLDVKFWAWTGLNDRENEADYKWTDGSIFNYTNWREGDPSEYDRENCVHMLYEPGNDLIGKWNDRTCDGIDAYICEMKANPRKRSPNLLYCSSEEGGGWKFQTSCYHIVTEMQTWQNAERYCKNYYKGHLVTIRDTLEDLFLDYILANMNKEVWIGIKMQDQLQQKWTSGWYVSYNDFIREDLDFIQGTCVARKGRKEWITVPCSEQLPFVCEVSKVKPPVLTPPSVRSHCPNEPEGWRDLGGEYCYYIAAANWLNFYEASFDCKIRGGDLVSLHSKEESDILQPFVQYSQRTIGPSKIFIGLIRLLTAAETFAWTDGSAMDYENWNYNEPNNENEKCVEAVTTTMGWNDISCEDKKGYICSVKKIVPNSTIAGETAGCANFCIDKHSYLFGIISQCPEAKRIS